MVVDLRIAKDRHLRDGSHVVELPLDLIAVLGEFGVELLGRHHPANGSDDHAQAGQHPKALLPNDSEDVANLIHNHQLRVSVPNRAARGRLQLLTNRSKTRFPSNHWMARPERAHYRALPRP